MRSARTATIVGGLALWAVLALAPLIGACLTGDCTVDEGVRAAHCSMPATVMLCCEEAPEVPLVASAPTDAPPPHAALGSRGAATVRSDSREEHVRTVASTSHGPPLYELFATLLI